MSKLPPLPILPRTAKSVLRAIPLPVRKKPSLHEIHHFYENQLKLELSALEVDRARIVKLFYWLTAAALLGSGGFFFVMKKLFMIPPDDLELIVVPIFLYNGALIALYSKQYMKFSRAFKQGVMNKITEKFFPGFLYRPDAYVSRELFEEAKLISSDIDRYGGNDHFSGKMQGLPFQFSELLVQDQRGSGKNRQTVTVFRGFFLVAHFAKDIYFRTTIKPDVAEKFLGILGRGLQRVGSGQRLVDLEDPEFEKLFVVTSDDQVEARYILTPTLMEKIKKFRAQWEAEISLCFVNGKLFVALPTDKDYFEPSIWGEVFSRKDIMELIDCVQWISQLVEEIAHNSHFNTRSL